MRRPKAGHDHLRMVATASQSHSPTAGRRFMLVGHEQEGTMVVGS